MKLYAPSTIREIKDKYDFRLSKSLGQNFLTDKNIIDKIIEESFIGENDLVIEIGPGIGVLTAEAAEQAGKVIAVEIDKNLIPILKDTLSQYDNVEVVNRDILKSDLNEMIAQSSLINGKSVNSVRIIGNLPYYITTPIIMKILEDGVKADSITIMMQKEVADRIKAEAGKKAYGALSVAVQYYCTVSHVANVPKEVFVPQPKVDSTVIRLDIRKEKPVKLKDEKIFFQCVKAGFGQRRKTMLNSLTGVCGLSKEQVGQVMESIGIDSGRRAETMNIDEFANLANSVYDKIRG
ncbi:16S rRNA (adenine(1518)-N(6)/adenine(1519)-N(6))-dimethyltransferase RsmA [Aminipila terrae]|uniref:Ribosomal RNA small subunit methyltransferase A n=1 Tax=Aminipila terrae TaxID=2697030 RepID=A0A6P1MG92_9FIRM|nr:16S rRNA (adenine(1518)-N(6)/adenine(1519)-N(6))-dimethyltransferase RsmA [Aminipila terrae]QHI72203.1 16S rRNA (adenine(1518)-N(6)/adenine(1519)-N(6))-dimethyltransferase RsmA [Aminipila terrae]